jgi:PKHD-type hydroxylase
MILHIPQVLTPEQVRHCHAVLGQAAWVDGRVTAGEQSGQAKHNLQVPEESDEARALGEIVLKALAASPRFMSAALPLRVYPPLFNRYSEGMGFGAHIDNAIRVSPVTGGRYRTDLSCTIFLTDPDAYDGGELIIGDDLADRGGVKLPAGDMVLYPATTVHSVAPVTRGERWASFFWVQSLAPDPTQRATLFELDQAIIAARADLGDAHPAAVSLVGVYHNLVRMWSQV